jgi:hypothetical protein
VTHKDSVGIGEEAWDESIYLALIIMASIPDLPIELKLFLQLWFIKNEKPPKAGKRRIPEPPRIPLCNWDLTNPEK